MLISDVWLGLLFRVVSSRTMFLCVYAIYCYMHMCWETGGFCIHTLVYEYIYNCQTLCCTIKGSPSNGLMDMRTLIGCNAIGLFYKYNLAPP